MQASLISASVGMGVKRTDHVRVGECVNSPKEDLTLMPGRLTGLLLSPRNDMRFVKGLYIYEIGCFSKNKIK